MSSSPSRSPSGTVGGSGSGREQSPGAAGGGGGGSKSSHGSRKSELKVKLKKKTGGKGGEREVKHEGSKRESSISSQQEARGGGGGGSKSSSQQEAKSSTVNSSTANSNSGPNSGSNGQDAASPVPSKMAANSPGPGGPFEKLKQALLEQEQKKTSSKGGLKGKSEHSSSGSGQFNHHMFRGHMSAGADGRPSSSSGKGQKNDPYEFNAKNEDRMGLPNKKPKTEKERFEMRDQQTETCHLAVMTDPDCFGPCEPGTSVVLEGIVWQETENAGLLVVNVTWRGKTYVGTLLDATKHEWAPPRSDSPQDPEARTPRSGRGKRGRTTMNSMGGRGTRTTRNSACSTRPPDPPPSPAKSTNSGNGENKRKAEAEPEAAPLTPIKKPKLDGPVEPTIRTVAVDEITWYVCSHPTCHKRYRNLSGLRYHQADAHKDLLLRLQSLGDDVQEEPEVKPKKAKKSKDSAAKEAKGSPTKGGNSPGSGKSGKSPNEKLSPDVKFNPVIQLTPVSTTGSISATGPSGTVGAGGVKTVSAPLFNVPRADEAVEKEEKKKDRKDKKKKKKDRKKDKEAPVPQSQSSHESEAGQASKTANKEPGIKTAELSGPKLAEVGTANEAVQSPAYSDISDEGNDNVPILENEMEPGPKDSGESLPKVVPQEPPNLTPVITHTAHSNKSSQPPHTSSSQSLPPPPPAQPLPASVGEVNRTIPETPRESTSKSAEEKPAAPPRPHPGQYGGLGAPGMTYPAVTLAPHAMPDVQRATDSGASRIQRPGMKEESRRIEGNFMGSSNAHGKKPHIDRPNLDMPRTSGHMMHTKIPSNLPPHAQPLAGAPPSKEAPKPHEGLPSTPGRAMPEMGIERRMENEQILKENIELKSQMTEKERGAQENRVNLDQRVEKERPNLDPQRLEKERPSLDPPRHSLDQGRSSYEQHHRLVLDQQRAALEAQRANMDPHRPPPNLDRPDQSRMGMDPHRLSLEQQQRMEKERAIEQQNRLHQEFLKQREMSRDLPRDLAVARDLSRDAVQQQQREHALAREMAAREGARDHVRELPRELQRDFRTMQEFNHRQAMEAREKMMAMEAREKMRLMDAKKAHDAAKMAQEVKMAQEAKMGHVPAVSRAPPPGPTANVSKMDGSPLHSPKTKAELKQGPGERKDQRSPRPQPDPRDTRPTEVKRYDAQSTSQPPPEKSPAPSPRLSSPMTPHQFPFPYGLPPHMLPGYPAYLPYLPAGYPPLPHDPKAMEMLLQHHASQQQQLKAQDLRKPDRRSPSGLGGSGGPSMAHGLPGGPETSKPSHLDPRQSPGIPRSSPQVPTNPWNPMPNGRTMMQHSPPSSSKQH